MDKIYEKGDIIFLRNLKFEDGKIDFRLRGHPYLLLENVYNEGQIVKALRITSNPKYRKNKMKLKDKTLPRRSYVVIQEKSVCVNISLLPYSHINHCDLERLKQYNMYI